MSETSKTPQEKVEEVRGKIRNISVDGEEVPTDFLEDVARNGTQEIDAQRAEEVAVDTEGSDGSDGEESSQAEAGLEKNQDSVVSRRELLGLKKIRKLTEDAKAEVQTAKSEKDPEKSERSAEKEQKNIVSRRDFMKKSAVATATVAVAAGSMGGFVKSPEVKAGLKDTLEFDDVKEGSHDEMVKELYDVVFENDKEIARFHFKAFEEFKTKEFFKGRTDEGWFDGKGLEYAESSVIIPPENFEVLMDNPSKIENVSFFHTHPAAAIESINEKLEKDVSVKDLPFEDHGKENQEKERMTLPLSEADLNVFMNVCMEYPEAADLFSMEVVEPTGHWKIERDLESESVENFQRMQTKYQQEVDKFNKLEEEEKNKYRKKAILAFMEENRDSGLFGLRGVLSDKNAIFTTFKNNEDYFSKLRMLSEIGKKMILCKSDKKRDEVAEKFVEAAKTMGLSAEYNQMCPQEKKAQQRNKGSDR
ncbi:MAG: twin-arginine translocation signal domain-containing protein [Patescibacteria group bacterium]|nr:twin-arginine translocation signal domain-containing protein [Patescibacteria group bacterium]